MNKGINQLLNLGRYVKTYGEQIFRDSTESIYFYTGEFDYWFKVINVMNKTYYSLVAGGVDEEEERFESLFLIDFTEDGDFCLHTAEELKRLGVEE